MLDGQRLARNHVTDDLIDLGAVQGAFDAQDCGQHDHVIPLGISAMNVSIAPSLAAADQQSARSLGRKPSSS